MTFVAIVLFVCLSNALLVIAILYDFGMFILSDFTSIVTSYGSVRTSLVTFIDNVIASFTYDDIILAVVVNGSQHIRKF